MILMTYKNTCLNNYNCRCKRLHPLLATAFQVLDFLNFLEDTGLKPLCLQ